MRKHRKKMHFKHPAHYRARLRDDPTPQIEKQSEHPAQTSPVDEARFRGRREGEQNGRLHAYEEILNRMIEALAPRK